MKHTFFLAPISSRAGITTVSLGLVRALDKRGLRVGFCKPIGQLMVGDEGPDRSTHFLRATTTLEAATPIALDRAEKMVSEGRADDLMGIVMQEFHDSSREADIMIVEGLVPVADDSYIGKLNTELVRTLNADVVLVGNAGAGMTQQLRDQIELSLRRYSSAEGTRVAGCILNRLRVDEQSPETGLNEARRAYASSGAMPPLVGLIPENRSLTYCRTIDIARHLDAGVLFAGEMEKRRVRGTHLLARTVPNMMHVFRPGNILIAPADRDDIMMATSLAALDGVPIAGLVLTGDTLLDERIYALCQPGFRTGLPVLRVPTNSYDTASRLNAMSGEVPVDDIERISTAMEYVSEFIDAGWIEERCKRDLDTRLSPAAFCFRLTERAKAANKRIILPEGSEPRTIRAAAICAERGFARCVLLGDPDEIARVATANEIVIPPGCEIINASAVRANYVDALVEFRKHKNLSRTAAADQIEDDVVLGTVMLALGEGDGLVSGAVHSSASTVRPALQIIKTKPGVNSVSSIFFMCLPDHVLVYGDCAVIQDPDAATMAEIAIQSAESAAQFGIPPRVAMISYSTGESGSGADVDKVREATRIAKAARPDLLIDGPLQYDAAAIADVAAKKAPKSPVAGKATVFVFPDLNTGNTTYKAVQRSANVISIGPMLQGLRRPVNDLSRGALVQDIVYTIALTAVQAAQG
jgi:phosphate acetyltransferase